MARYSIRIHMIRSWLALVNHQLTGSATGFGTAHGELLCGLLSVVERKNGWWLAEHAGHVSPDRMQRLLRTAVWDHESMSRSSWNLGGGPTPESCLVVGLG